MRHIIGLIPEEWYETLVSNFRIINKEEEIHLRSQMIN